MSGTTRGNIKTCTNTGTTVNTIGMEVETHEVAVYEQGQHGDSGRKVRTQ